MENNPCGILMEKSLESWKPSEMDEQMVDLFVKCIMPFDPMYIRNYLK
jgi:hypothetical protein